LLLYNALDLSFEFVKLRKNPKCKVCGPLAEVTDLIDYQEFCGLPHQDHEKGTAGADWDITATELAQRIQAKEPVILLDVREPHETQISNLPNTNLIPLGELASRLVELDSADEIVIFCKSGIRSVRALELLVSAGFRKVKNLKGGINAWAKEVDQQMPVY
jgi:adenylyltransferase/sulfurtransferase